MGLKNASKGVVLLHKLLKNNKLLHLLISNTLTMKLFNKYFCAALLLLVLPMNLLAQQPKLIKVSEFSVSNIPTIEERVFMIHSITDQGYFCFKNPDISNTIDVYVSSDASDELSDFDFFYDNLLYEQRNAFSLLDKATRGNLFVQWRQAIDDEIYKLIYEDFTKGMSSENPTCETSLPFCTNNGLYNFPAGVNAGSAGSGDPYYCYGVDHQGQDNCLSTSPNPAFYFMRIDEPGNLDIYMYSTPSHDIDFDCWGPFDDIATACDQLSCSNMMDCSYDPASTEHCHINNAQTGQYYVLLITNFSNQTCNINFVNQGTGTTDCSILPPLVDNDGPYCVGETIHLSAIGQSGATYSWTGPNNFTSTLQNPVIENCTLGMSGNYTCTITLAGETNSAVTTLSVFAIPEAGFEATTVCLGNPTDFNSTATTSDGQQITSYGWDFGDGTTESGENATHTFAEAGTFSVTHHVGTRAGCESQVTLPVVVVAAPVASFTATTVCQGDATQFTSTSTGDQISGYQWDFGDGQTGSGQTVTHTYTQAGNFQVTLTAEGSGGTCSGNVTQTVTVYAMPIPSITATPPSVDYSGTSVLTANPGAEGSFSYHWEPENMVTDPNSPTTQTAALIEDQTYTLTVTNNEGGCTQTIEITVLMGGSNMTATASADNYELCENGSTTLHAHPINGTQQYTYSWTPNDNTLSNTSVKDPVATPPVGTTTYSCHISDGIISQDVSVSVTVHPNKSTDIHHAICDGTSFNFFGQNLTAEGVYHHTLQTQHGCDSVINLYLEKMQVFETTLSDYFCEGDTYTFFGQQLSAPGTYSHTMQTQQGCDSIVKLNLSLSPVEHSQFTVPDGENCDSYFWDPRGHQIVQTDHPDLTYTNSGTYHRTYLNHAGCDSIVTMDVRFEYTPDPTPIYPVDETNTAPHWVVSATEFQINTYDFQLWDNNPLCYWDTVTWTLEGASDWFTEPFGNKAKQCKVYVLSQVSDTVWLTAHAFNRCAPTNGVMQRYWLVCSFYGIDEQEAALADFSVVPNPNNGQMTLNFEHLTGKVNVKVYDMQGALIDDFETYNGSTADSFTYSMKDKADGIYFFVATGREGTKAKKVIIQH